MASFDISSQQLANAATQHLKQLAIDRPLLTVVPGHRLNTAKVAVRIALDRYDRMMERDPGQAVATAILRGVGDMHQHMRTDAAECVGCDHAAVNIEQFMNPNSDAAVFQLNSTCKSRECVHDVMVYDQPTLSRFPGDPSLPTTVTRRKRSDVPLSEDDLDDVEHLVRLQRIPESQLTPAVPSPTRDVPLTPSDLGDAW